MIHSNFGQSITPQNGTDRVADAPECQMNLTDRVTIMGPPEWMPVRRAPQLVGMPAFANVRDSHAPMFHNGRAIRPVEFLASSDLGVA